MMRDFTEAIYHDLEGLDAMPFSGVEVPLMKLNPVWLGTINQRTRALTQLSRYVEQFPGTGWAKRSLRAIVWAANHDPNKYVRIKAAKLIEAIE